ncbi:MAG: hypothetical protein IJY23_07320 [Clostridia bacterium]|nr:hypothetical protein [Clostridia bacterium]
MTVETFAKEFDFKVLSLPSPEKEVTGAYVGDLLSWVMGRANSGDVWITIMSNVNIAAVATLADTACILLAEGVVLDDEVLSVAKNKGINVLSSEKSAYSIAKMISDTV